MRPGELLLGGGDGKGIELAELMLGFDGDPWWEGDRGGSNRGEVVKEKRQ